LARSGPAQDLIVVAAPLRASAAVLSGLAERKPGAVVFDIGSLKSPLRGGLEALRAAGVRVTSIHPMFGPSANVLAGRHVIFIDLGVPEATEAARSLFAHTTAVPVNMSLDEHDRAIGYVLGLSHALNIAFFTALAQSGEMAERLAELSSTTFDRQLAIARGVADENPHLYYEIQRLERAGRRGAVGAGGGDAAGACVRALGRRVRVRRADAGRSRLLHESRSRALSRLTGRCGAAARGACAPAPARR
jgi:chorismate mutase/prephenate dehydrogenase